MMTYDQWKTTNPRDQEPEGEAYYGDDGRTELDEVYERLDDAKAKEARAREIADGLYGLLQLIFNRPDVSDELRDAIANNHRVVDAGNYLQPESRLEWPRF